MIERHIKDMLRAKLIEPCDSPWASPTLVVPKKDGTTRFCSDYRKLNGVTTPIATPINCCNEIFDNLAYAKPKWMCLCDLKSGYSHMEMDEDAKKKAAFVTHLGQFCPTRLNFGTKTAPQYFTKMMAEVLLGLQYKHCLIYIDDCLIFGKTFEEMLTNLNLVLERFAKNGLRLNPKKCLFGRREIPFLGYYVSEHGFRTDPAKLEVIQKCPSPNDTKNPVKSLRSFLGLASYYRKFVKNFAKIAAPLYDLLKQHVKWEWTPERQNSFATLKEALLNSPILGFPDFSKSMILQCDASNKSVGCVLSQVIDNKPVVLGYAGRSLTERERSYHTCERELLAILHGLSTFSVYLSHVPCEIQTDHASLKWLMNAKQHNSRLQRWAMKISTYQCPITYQSASKMNNADGISRFPFEDMKLEFNKPDLDEEELYHIDIQSTLKSVTPAEFREKQSNDPHWKAYVDYINEGILPEDEKFAKKLILESQHFDIIDGLLCHLQKQRYGTVKQVCMPEEFQSELIQQVHDDVTSGGAHFGFDKTYANLKTKYYFPHMAKLTEEFCKTCPTCQVRKGSPKRQAKMVSLPKVTRPFQRVCMDFATMPESVPEKYKNVLILVDAYTRHVEAYPTKDQSAVTVAKCLLTYTTTYGICEEILTDRAQNFQAELMNEFYKLVGTKHIKTSSYHPQTNQSERYVQTVKNAISMYCKNKQTWAADLRCIVYALNCTPSPNTTSYSAYYMLFGRLPKYPIDARIGFEEDNADNPVNYPELIGQRLQEAYLIADKCLQIAEQKKVKYYDKLAHETKFKPGDIVYLYIGNRVHRHCGRGMRKLVDRWEGPYFVTNVLPTGCNYHLRCAKTGKLRKGSFHANALKLGKVKLGQYTLTAPKDSNMPSKKTPDSEQVQDLPPGWYEIQKILQSKYSPKYKCRLYKIHWKGYPRAQSTWEKAESIPQPLRDAYHSVVFLDLG